MSKYRFKTEKEFKRDGLWNKNCPVKWVSVMNKYLGKDIPDEYNHACNKQEKFRYDQWHIEPHDYVLKEESFVLPSKWCVKVDRDCQPEEVYKWRKMSWVHVGYIYHDKHWSHRVFSSDTEITLEQFKQHVLKESPVVETIVETLNQEEDYTGRTIKALVKSPQGTRVQLGEVIKILIKENKDTYILERTARDFSNMRINRPLDLSDWELLPESPKEIDMKEIQEEAKKRFPIGCKFIPADSHKTHTLIEDDCTYEIHGKYIWAHNGHGHLYEDGKWATLVSLPEIKKEMFYEGDYIVTLDVEDGYNCARKNYCFKQRINCTGMAPEVDLKGSTSNSHSVMSFGKKEWLKDWRYATPEEAAEYERIGKPYDVTTLQKKEESIPEYVECVRSLNHARKGIIYKVINDTRCESDNSKVTYGWRTSDYTPSTKEAYDAQFVSKSTVIEEWSEGTYAVGIKGGFGLFSESEKPVGLGKIYTIEQNRGTTIAVKESSFWVSRENLRWFATHEEALAFSRGFKTSPVPKESDYPVMPVDAYPSIKKETFIDNVQSVDVMLRTKRKSIKF